MSTTDTTKISGYAVTNKRSARAIYMAQLFLGDFEGAGGDAQWLPLSQLSNLTIGEEFPGNNGERRAEFYAEIPNWLARKIFPVRTGPIPQAQRPW